MWSRTTVASKPYCAQIKSTSECENVQRPASNLLKRQIRTIVRHFRCTTFKKREFCAFHSNPMFPLFLHSQGYFPPHQVRLTQHPRDRQEACYRLECRLF